MGIRRFAGICCVMICVGTAHAELLTADPLYIDTRPIGGTGVVAIPKNVALSNALGRAFYTGNFEIARGGGANDAVLIQQLAGGGQVQIQINVKDQDNSSDPLGMPSGLFLVTGDFVEPGKFRATTGIGDQSGSIFSPFKISGDEAWVQEGEPQQPPTPESVFTPVATLTAIGQSAAYWLLPGMGTIATVGAVVWIWARVARKFERKRA